MAKLRMNMQVLVDVGPVGDQEEAVSLATDALKHGFKKSGVEIVWIGRKGAELGCELAGKDGLDEQTYLKKMEELAAWVAEGKELGYVDAEGLASGPTGHLYEAVAALLEYTHAETTTDEQVISALDIASLVKSLQSEQTPSLFRMSTLETMLDEIAAYRLALWTIRHNMEKRKGALDELDAAHILAYCKIVDRYEERD